jgi:hypothetical protein
MNTPFASVLCSIRGKRLRSHLDTLKDKNDIEVLLKIDSDDDPFDHIKYLRKNDFCKIIIYGESSGYNDLHLFYTDLCKLAQGSMLWIFYDDIMVLSDNWIDKLRLVYDIFDDHIVACVFNTKIINKYGNFRDAEIYKSIIVSKEWFQCCSEYISPTCDIDGYLVAVGKKLCRLIYIKDVNIATGITKKSAIESRAKLPPSSQTWNTDVDYHVNLIKPHMKDQNVILPEGMSFVE